MIHRSNFGLTSSALRSSTQADTCPTPALRRLSTSLALLLVLSLQARSPAEPALQLGAGTVREPVAQTLVRIAATNRLPLALVLDQRALCSPPAGELVLHASTPAQLAAELNTQLPQYRFRWDAGILHAQPRSMPPQIADLLNYRIKDFKTATSDTHSGMAISLWIHQHGQLISHGGAGFAGGSPPYEEHVPGFTSADATIEQNLDHIITLGRGGAWIVKTSELGWRSGNMSFAVYGYVGDAELLASEVCHPEPSGTVTSTP